MTVEIPADVLQRHRIRRLTMIPTKTLASDEVGPFRVNLIREKSNPVMTGDPQLWSVEVWRDYHKEDWACASFLKEEEARAHMLALRDQLTVKTAQLALGL